MRLFILLGVMVFTLTVEKEGIVVDADYIGPILEETGKQFREVFMGAR